MRIAITGHRPNKLWNDYDLTSPGMQSIKATLERAIAKFCPTLMISGMALGIDTLWAELAIENRIPLLACTPCWGQERKWPERSQDRFNKIINTQGVELMYTHRGYYNQECMQKRNVYMVDNCDMLLAVWDGTIGGTANCVHYARSVDKKGWIINPHTLKITPL